MSQQATPADPTDGREFVVSRVLDAPRDLASEANGPHGGPYEFMFI